MERPITRRRKIFDLEKAFAKQNAEGFDVDLEMFLFDNMFDNMSPEEREELDRRVAASQERLEAFVDRTWPKRKASGEPPEDTATAPPVDEAEEETPVSPDAIAEMFGSQQRFDELLREMFYERVAAGDPHYVSLLEKLVRFDERTPALERTKEQEQRIAWPERSSTRLSTGRRRGDACPSKHPLRMPSTPPRPIVRSAVFRQRRLAPIQTLKEPQSPSGCFHRPDRAAAHGQQLRSHSPTESSTSSVQARSELQNWRLPRPQRSCSTVHAVLPATSDRRTRRAMLDQPPLAVQRLEGWLRKARVERHLPEYQSQLRSFPPSPKVSDL